MSQKIKNDRYKKNSQPKVTIDKKINLKNYIYAVLILLGGIFLTLYIFEWINVKKEEKLMSSYLITSNTIDSSIDNLDSLTQIIQEAPRSYFIYLSYTGNEDVYNFEKELKRIIDKYDLSDIFYYVDLTALKDNNKNYIEEIKNKLGLKKLDNLPALIYINDGNISESNVLDGKQKNFISINDVENLLDIYDFEIVK